MFGHFSAMKSKSSPRLFVFFNTKYFVLKQKSHNSVINFVPSKTVYETISNNAFGGIWKEFSFTVLSKELGKLNVI